MQFIENRTYDELRAGDSVTLARHLRIHDVQALAALAGERLQSGAAAPARADEALWGGALVVAAILGEWPGPGSVCLSQNLRFLAALPTEAPLQLFLRLRTKDDASGEVLLDCRVSDAGGTALVEGEVRVLAPRQKQRRPRLAPADLPRHEPGAAYHDLLKATHALPPLPTAVVHPCDELSLAGALEAARENLILPLLVGPRAKLERVAQEASLALDGAEIVDVPHSHAAAARATALVREGRAQALMKGSLHTDEFMAAVIDADAGLRTERRMSHVFALDVPTYPKPLFITDAAINIAPDLVHKRDIAQNAIDLAHALGIALPRVAVLSAVETVNPKIPSTLEAAALCKMLDRGQITGAVIDGPLAFDNAISRGAARSKAIASPVAGEADILLVPDLESGNMLAKQLIYLAGAEAAGIVLGARVPIMLTSRSDGMLARLASCALALLFAHRARSGT